MGIKSLKKLLLKNCINKGAYKERRISDFRDKTIFIDTSIYLYQYKYYGEILPRFAKMISILLKYNITPIFVFDGKPTQHKDNVLQERRERKEKLDAEIIELTKKIEIKVKEIREVEDKSKIDIEKEQQVIKEHQEQIYKKEKQNIKVTFRDVKDLKKLLYTLGIPFIHKQAEADVVIPYVINKFNLEPLCLSDDTDFLAHGMNMISRFNIGTEKVEFYNYPEILDTLSISKDNFTDMCIVMGCDYYKGVKGIGPMKSYSMISKNKDKPINEIFKNLDVTKYLESKMMFSGNCEFEIEENFKLTEFNQEEFEKLCEENDMDKNILVQYRIPKKINTISNYFKKKEKK